MIWRVLQTNFQNNHDTECLLPLQVCTWDAQSIKKMQKNSPNPRQGNFPEFFLGIPYISCYLAQSIKYIYTLTGMSFDHFLCLLCNYIKAIMLHDLELNKSFTSNLNKGSLYKSYARKNLALLMYDFFLKINGYVSTDQKEKKVGWKIWICSMKWKEFMLPPDKPKILFLWKWYFYIYLHWRPYWPIYLWHLW